MVKSNGKILRVFFIRHKLTQKDVDMLRRKRRIAIQFNKESFHQWEDYSKKNRKELKFKRAWDQFQKIKKGGAIVVAQDERGEYVIGKVKKGSRLKFIPSSKSKDFSLKTLKLHNIKHVTQKQSQMISMFKPMRSTVNAISKGANFVLQAYGVIRYNPSLANLHYKLQETMCAEWLRSKHCPKHYRIKYLLANIGHGMEAVDIVGRTNCRKKIICSSYIFRRQGKGSQKTRCFVEIQ